MNAFGGGMLGMRVIQSEMVPIKRKPGPRQEMRSKGHPLVYWLARQLARVGVSLEPDVVTWRETWIEEPEFFLIGSTIMVHPKFYPALREMIAAANRDRSADGKSR